MVGEIAFSCVAPGSIPRSNGCRFDKSSEAGSRPERFRNSFEGDGVFSAWRLPRVLFDFVQVNFFHGCKSPQRSRSSQRRIQNFSVSSASSAVKDSFFAIEVISLRSFHDQFFGSFPCHGPLAAVGIITGITRRAAAARIVGDHVINKILIADITKLMCFARLKQKRVARSTSVIPFLSRTLPRPETTR